MKVVGTISSEDILCEYCQNDFSSCPKAVHIKFGNGVNYNGVGNDNVIECSEFIVNDINAKYPIIEKAELGIFKKGE